MLFLPKKDIRELSLKKFDSKANFKFSIYKKIFIKSARVGREAPSGSYPDSSISFVCYFSKMVVKSSLKVSLYCSIKLSCYYKSSLSHIFEVILIGTFLIALRKKEDCPQTFFVVFLIVASWFT